MTTCRPVDNRVFRHVKRKKTSTAQSGWTRESAYRSPRYYPPVNTNQTGRHDPRAPAGRVARSLTGTRGAGISSPDSGHSGRSRTKSRSAKSICARLVRAELMSTPHFHTPDLVAASGHPRRDRAAAESLASHATLGARKVRRQRAPTRSCRRTPRRCGDRPAKIDALHRAVYGPWCTDDRRTGSGR